MVPISMAGMKKKLLITLHVMYYVKVFATKDGQLDGQPNEDNSPHRSICYSYVMYYVTVFATKDGQPDRQPNEDNSPHRSICYSYVMYYVTVFATQDGQLEGQPNEDNSPHRSICYSYRSKISKTLHRTKASNNINKHFETIGPGCNASI